MKNLFCLSLIIILTLFITPLNAQVQLGLQAGANLGDVSLDPTPEGVTTGMRAGLMFGGVFFYSFSPIIGLQVEPAYVQKGATIDITQTENGMTVKLEGTLTGDYIDIPVLLKASFGEGPVKPYLLAGASIAFSLGDAIIELDNATIDGQSIPIDQSEDTVKVKSTDIILNFGGGVIIPAGQVNIFVEAQYNLGLSNVNDEPTSPGEEDMTIKTTGIQIKAGVLFPL
ncbi:MAG: PorT family protein [Ignavibacteria bacterium]|nr:PorT family protein [Ignavibacteria bacterium]